MPSALFPLAALFAFLAASPTRADTKGGSAVPLALRSPDAQEREDPGIGKPVDPGVDCLAGGSNPAEQSALREAHANPNNKSCLPQSDAFKRAAEAASYLAIYQQNFSEFGRLMQDSGKKKEIQDAVNACVNNEPSCSSGSINGEKTRAYLLEALVQHNFAKELRAQVIENNSRAERLRSIDSFAKIDTSQGPGGIPTKILSWNNSLRTRPLRERTFRLDPREVKPIDLTKISLQERALLGKDFNNNFDSFVNAYTSSEGPRGPKSRWHYVEARSSALENKSVTVADYDRHNQDTRENYAAIDKASLAYDVRTQNSPEVKEIIETYRKHRGDTLANPTGSQTVSSEKNVKKEVGVDSMKLAYDDAGFGLDREQLAQIGKAGDAPRSPKDVADLIVVSINRAITLREKQLEQQDQANQARFPSSTPNGIKPIFTPSVTVEMHSFDAFLDEIWPGGPGALRTQNN